MSLKFLLKTPSNKRETPFLHDSLLLSQHIPESIYFHFVPRPGPGQRRAGGIATRYGLETMDIESRWGAKFCTTVQTGPGTHPPSCTHRPWGPNTLLYRSALGPTNPPVQTGPGAETPSSTMDTGPGAHPPSCTDRPWGPNTLLYRSALRPKHRPVQTGPGAETPSCTDRPWGPPTLLYNGHWPSFPGVKRLGRGFGHPTASSAEVKELVQLCLYSPPSGLFLLPFSERKLVL